MATISAEKPRSVEKTNQKALWREHALILAFYTGLSIAVSWPTVRDFTSLLVSSGGDARNNLWMLWHVKEFVLGNQALFDMPLLYYPVGISLLTRGLGPLVGLFGLPFWPWGAEAAHNGALLVELALTGYFMYLLARGLKLGRGVALFAGTMLLVAPLHLVGILGHMTKTFLGMIPLVLLAWHYTLDRQRSPWWAVVTAVLLLLTLLHNGYQFVFVSLAIAFFAATAFLAGDRARRVFLVKRGLLSGFAVLVLVVPLLAAMIQASQNSAIPVDKNRESFHNQPDLVEVLLPPGFHWLLGERVDGFLESYDADWSVETAVSLSWTGILLSLVALAWASRRARPWIWFTFACVVFALGPSLKFLGQRAFTEYELPIILPYAFVTALPGLDFMRAPGRFMMIGYVTFSLAASFGLAWLVRRWPDHRRFILLLTTLLVLVESWPRPWPQERLRPVPDFYQQIASDEALYGVFDLPVIPQPDRWHAGYASYYQMYQMTHDKGLASGYVARAYKTHPLFPCVIPRFRPLQPDVLVNGEPTACYANTRFDLAHADYRYVVFHKPQPWYPQYVPGSWGEAAADVFIHRFFKEDTPVVDDELVTVYAVEPLPDPSDNTPTLALLDNWYAREESWRWAASPATLLVSVPQAQPVTLEIVLEMLYDPAPDPAKGTRGQLTIALGEELATTVTAVPGEPVRVPFDLSAGIHKITFSLAAGNFRPSDRGSEDRRQLSFAIRDIDLQTQQATAAERIMGR